MPKSYLVKKRYKRANKMNIKKKKTPQMYGAHNISNLFLIDVKYVVICEWYTTINNNCFEI